MTTPNQPLIKTLWFQVLIAMTIGIAMTLVTDGRFADWVGWMGTIFVRLLKMIIVPLILTSIVTGVASVGGGKSLGRLGIKTFSYYILTSLAAILTGLVFVNVLRPGVGANLVDVTSKTVVRPDTSGSLLDIFYRMIPTNPIAALSSGDMLAIIFFAILVGVSITQLPENRRNIVHGLFTQGFELMMVLTTGIIRFLPLGVLGLISKAVAESGLETFRVVGLYAITIVGALSVHWLITLPLLLRVLGGMNPRVHYRNMSEAFLTAFSTSSSASTLPVTLRSVETKVGVSNKVTSFVIPMGATINMDGTALYECVGAIFIAQVLGFDLSLADQATIVITALLASIGTAAVPSAGLVMIFIVTEAVGMRGPEVATIVGVMLAVDRPLDMFRTMVNVTSDSAGAAIIARTEGEADVNRA